MNTGAPKSNKLTIPELDAYEQLGKKAWMWAGIGLLAIAGIIFGIIQAAKRPDCVPLSPEAQEVYAEQLVGVYR